MEKKANLKLLLLLGTDLFSLLFSTVFSWLILKYGLQAVTPYTAGEFLQFGLILLCVFVVVFLWFSHPESFAKRTWKRELLVVIQFNLSLAAGLAICLLMVKAGMVDSRHMFVAVVCGNTVVQFLVRQGLKRFLNLYFRKTGMATLVGIITTTDRAAAIVRDLGSDWTVNIQGIALLDTFGDGPAAVEGVPVVADYQGFMDWLRHESLDEVYINLPYDTGNSMRPYLEEIESMGPAVHLNIPILEPYMCRQQELAWMPTVERTLGQRGGVPFVTLTPNQHSFLQLACKRLMDIAGALVGLVISVPIIAITAIPLKLESPGPLFFKQKRVGRNGRVFYIHKLRSMYVDAEERKKELMAQNKMNGLMFKMDDDPRITKVGKFIRKTSIDELPQFLDVLVGHMSLVGTRPPTMDEYRQYESHHKRRLAMKPGITGLWQVSGRSDIQEFEEVVRLDTTYIDNWSLWLDVKILLKTVLVVFTGRGAE